MKASVVVFLFLSIFLVSCSQIRDSAGVNRKNIDEFRVIENPPLVIPPDFNLLPPEQLKEKNIANVESDLAKEILFGLNEESNVNESNTSTMENILNQTNAYQSNNDIRQEIDEQFASEKNIDSNTWDNEIEILDSVAESQRLRNKLLSDDTNINEEVPTIKIENKSKKKKRFFFF
jgi:hypothetical protein